MELRVKITASGAQQGVGTLVDHLFGYQKVFRRITERNASGVKQTRSSTGELVAQAKALRALMAPARSRGNGGRRPRPSPETR